MKPRTPKSIRPLTLSLFALAIASLACSSGGGDENEAFCPNGVREAGEVCDGADLDGATCQSLGLPEGDLACTSDCRDYDRRGCGTPETCGNERLDDGEVCDDALLDGKTCADLGLLGDGLACAPDCLSFDTSACDEECQADCSGRECGPDPVCGVSCGECAEPAERCDEQSHQCVGVCAPDLQTDAVLDLDIAIHRVQISLTMDGQALPSDQLLDDWQRGSLVFIASTAPEDSAPDTLRLSLAEEGPAEFAVDLPAGSWDVWLLTENPAHQSVFPQHQEVLLQRGVLIDGEANLAFDCRPVELSGTITLDGAQMPDDTYVSNGGARAKLVIDPGYPEANEHPIEVELGETGPASYSVTLLAGTYDIDLVTGHPASQSVFNILSQRIPIAEQLAVATDHTLDHDLTTHVVSATITLDGQTMPDNGIPDGNRGNFRFQPASSSQSITRSVGSTGPASVEVVLLEDSYSVTFWTTWSSQQDLLPEGHKVEVAADLELNGTRSLTADVSTANISGELRIDGQPMPDQGTGEPTRGALWLFGTHEAKTEFPATGHSWSMDSLAGTLDTLLYEGHPDPAAEPLLDAQFVNLPVPLTVQGDTILDVDLWTARLNGTLTLNGAPLSDDGLEPSIPRAELLIDTDGTRYRRTIELPLGETGPASFSRTLFRGVHRLRVRTGRASGQDVLPPDQSIEVEAGLDLQDDQDLSIDLRTVHVSGTVSLAGDTDLGHLDGANLWFQRQDTGSVTIVPVTVGEGQAHYEAELFSGNYIISLRYWDALLDARVLAMPGCR